MTACINLPELSIIVPTWNEKGTIPSFFDSISSQKGVGFEVIIADGGSNDDTLATALYLGKEKGVEVVINISEKGRGIQLNSGAVMARSENLLFLHADSIFDDPLALRKALDSLLQECTDRKTDSVAGRFRLRFNRSSAEASLPYYYYESKARLNRPECAHGDQGILIPKRFFKRIGPFVQFPPMLSETLLFEKIRNVGSLILLPSEIFTSARRFETEGLYQRQVINAILMNAANMRWEKFFDDSNGLLYPSRDKSGQINLHEFLDGVQRLMDRMTRQERIALWQSTGEYVKGNAWQIAFSLDVRRNFKQRYSPGEGPTTLLNRFDRYLAPALDNAAGKYAAALLTWCWFKLIRRH